MVLLFLCHSNVIHIQVHACRKFISYLSAPLSISYIQQNSIFILMFLRVERQKMWVFSVTGCLDFIIISSWCCCYFCFLSLSPSVLWLSSTYIFDSIDFFFFFFFIEAILKNFVYLVCCSRSSNDYFQIKYCLSIDFDGSHMRWKISKEWIILLLLTRNFFFFFCFLFTEIN